MPSPVELYPLVVGWLQAMELAPRSVALVALAELVTALLAGQSLRPSALARALLSPPGVPARQRYKRVARAWTRPWLSPAWLSPRLVRAVLALVPPDPAGARTAGLTHLALDTVRCGPWEVFTLGVVWHGRVLPVGWAVLSYPWPKGTFAPTVAALVRCVAAAWPADRPTHVVADRAFPSRPLFDALRAAGWGWTIRLRAKSWVTVAGRPQWVRAVLAAARAGAWTLHAVTYGAGAHAVPGRLVVGRGLVVLPWHQRDAGSARHRATQHARRQRHLAGKHPQQPPDASRETAAWVALFTTHPDRLAALDSYRRRWAAEGSYRDAQGGWDGRSGWDLQRALARVHQAARAERLVGLWALGALLQTWVGHQAGLATAPAEVRAARAQWTTTGRLSAWARGHFALADRSGLLRAWLAAVFTDGAARVRARRRPRAPRGRLAPPTARRTRLAA